MNDTHSNHGLAVLAGILRYDQKLTTYKFALVRALNDLTLAYPDTGEAGIDVAVPLRVIAEQWLAYYWPFADPSSPVLQGPRSSRQGQPRNDIGFRGELTALRIQWEELVGAAKPADGYFLVSEMRVHRKRAGYPIELQLAFDRAVARIASAAEYPVQYAGQGGARWSVFARPASYRSYASTTVSLPGTKVDDRCVAVPIALWRAFAQMSVWVEALCIHEWALFVEGVNEAINQDMDRGAAYRLLTSDPESRRPLTWERNQIDILLLEGGVFKCPWSGKELRVGTSYDLDHIVPLSVYPANEMWNLVPADPRFNKHQKRHRLPSDRKMRAALPVLSATYGAYLRSDALAQAIREDARARFPRIPESYQDFPGALADRVARFVARVRESRLVGTF